MTEPDRASSDATQINCRITRDPKNPETLVINGRKLYGNTLWNDDIKYYILTACSDPNNADAWKRHSMVLVPRDTPGFRMVRNLTIMGYDHAPEGHGEYIYENARVPTKNIILGEGRAFEIAQGRLGPGRIHHCMRLTGRTERAYELALIRATDPRKKPRGKLIGEFDSNIERIASMRLRLDSSKILVPDVAAEIIDECMQMYGGQGLTQHTALPVIWTYARFVRIADGPDAAHRHQVDCNQIKTAPEFKRRHEEYQRRYEELCKQWGVEVERFW